MNYTKKIESEKEKIFKVIEELNRKDYYSASSGNISVKIDDDRYLITPSGVPTLNLKKEDLVLIDSRGKTISGKNDNIKPSSEIHMHTCCYKKRKDIGAIIHSHAPSSSAFAIAGISLDLCVMPETIMVFGEIPLVPYKTPATEKLGEIASEYAKKGYTAMLLENHGVIVFGDDIFAACNSLLIVEGYAKTLLNAILLGGIKTLSRNDVGDLNDLKKTLNFSTSEISCKIDSSMSQQTGIGNNSPEELEDLISKIISEEISKEM